MSERDPREQGDATPPGPEEERQGDRPEASEGAEPETEPREGASKEPTDDSPAGDDGEVAKAQAEKAKAEAEKAKAEAAAKARAEAAAKAKAAREAAEAAKPPWERDPSAPEWEEADEDDLVRSIREVHPDAVTGARTFAGDLVLEVQREAVQEVAGTLREGEGYELLVDVCGAHYPDREEGAFEVVYHVYSFEANRRVRFKVRTDEGAEVPSVVPVWAGANWCEREVYDMYGVRFSGHPDMTRILLWEGFNGHPLRKDFPVEGIDTGSAIYPEYYEESAGPVAGTGTGWKPAPPPEPAEETEEDSAD